MGRVNVGGVGIEYIEYQVTGEGPPVVLHGFHWMPLDARAS